MLQTADFNFGTGAFTVEGWYYHLEKTSSNVARRYFVHNETAWESSRWIIYCGYTGNPNRATFYTYDTYNANGNNPFLIGKQFLLLETGIISQLLDLVTLLDYL